MGLGLSWFMKIITWSLVHYVILTMIWNKKTKKQNKTKQINQKWRNTTTFVLSGWLRLHLVVWQAEVENLSLEERRLDDHIRLWFINFLESVLYHIFRIISAILKLLDNTDDAPTLLQGNAGKVEGFERRWKQSKVKSLLHMPTLSYVKIIRIFTHTTIPFFFFQLF